MTSLALANAIKQEKETKAIQIGKKEIKLSLVTDDLIISVENPKELTKKLLELICDYSNTAGYKINIQKSIAVPYSINEQLEFDI